MAGAAPFEIIAAPFDVYVAAVGTTFPDVSQTPSGSWFLLGTSGNKNYDDDGITVTHEQKIDEFTPVGLTASRKAFRTEEEFKLAFKLVDVSATQYAKVMNQASVTTAPGGGGTSGSLSFNLLMGTTVQTYALLARGVESAGGANFNTQYQVALCYQSASPAPVWKKGVPAALALEFTGLWDSALGFGKYVSQNVAFS
jgi:hypothetical protein